MLALYLESLNMNLWESSGVIMAICFLVLLAAWFQGLLVSSLAIDLFCWAMYWWWRADAIASVIVWLIDAFIDFFFWAEFMAVDYWVVSLACFA